MNRFAVRSFALALALAAATLIPACSRDRRSDEPAKEEPLVVVSAARGIEVKMTVDPPTVRYDRDILLLIEVSHPTGADVRLQSMDDRCHGFKVAGSLEPEPVQGDGTTRQYRRILLTPLVADEHRIAPAAVTYTNLGPAGASGWFPTRPLKLATLPPGRPGKDVEFAFKPVWIRPSNKTLAVYALLAAVACACVYGLYRLARRVHKQIKLMLMSPRERALHELAELIAKDLVGRNMVKDFYLELTMIVRRYIERQHKIRAPEQTTQEFLEAVSADPRFRGEVLSRLKTFLEAADLVKFAGYLPDKPSIDRATQTARDYVEKDAEQTDATPTGKEAR